MTKQKSLDTIISAYAEAMAVFRSTQIHIGYSPDAKAKAEAKFNIAAHNLTKALNKLDRAHSFAIGDVVKPKPGKKKGMVSRFRGMMEPLIVTDTSIASGKVEYGISGRAWYKHEDFELVSRATKATLAKVAEIHREEDDAL